jgi:hypothetical protein
MGGMEKKEYENLERISAILGMIGQSWSYVSQAFRLIPQSESSSNFPSSTSRVGVPLMILSGEVGRALDGIPARWTAELQSWSKL